MQTLLGAKSVDWNQAWREMRTNGDSPARQPKFWDGRAPSFAKHVARTDYARNFLKIMKPRPDWSVLDMGCGGGTLALPLSDRVGSITAVDFSEKMISILREQCTARGIRNIRTLCARWEDDWRQAGIGIHDVAIASRSLVVEDLQGGIEKLDQAARKRVYIVTIVGDGPHDRNAYTALGRELKVGPDYIYNYNLLYQMGIYAKVDFIDQKHDGNVGIGRDRFEQGPGEEKFFTEDGFLDTVVLDGTADLTLGLGDLDGQNLLGVIPLVQGMTGIEAVVALQPDQFGLKDFRDDLRHFRLADAGLTLQKQGFSEGLGQINGGGQRSLADIFCLFHGVLDFVYRFQHHFPSSFQTNRRTSV